MFYDYDKKSKRVVCYDRDVLSERVFFSMIKIFFCNVPRVFIDIEM